MFFRFSLLISILRTWLHLQKPLRLQKPNQTTAEPAKWNFLNFFPLNSAFQVFSLCCRLLILDIIRIFKIERYCYIIMLRNGFIEKKSANYICKCNLRYFREISSFMQDFIGFKIVNMAFRSFWKNHDALKLNCEKVW